MTDAHSTDPGDRPRPHQSRGSRAAWRGVLPDTGPWRTSRDFRLLWSSRTITSLGSVLALLALPVQVQRLTGSTLAVGALGAAELAPMLLLGLYGGALADALDRRRLALLTELALGLLALLLLGNALLDQPLLWLLYAAAATAAALQGLQQPALSALLPRLVPPEQLPAAFALGAISGNVAAVAGTAAAGVLVAVFDLPVAYVLDAVSFAGSAALISRMTPVPTSGIEHGPTLRSIADGLRYAAAQPLLIGTYLVDLAATVLALPFALFPFLATDLHAPWALGLLFAAGAVGSLTATATSGWTSRVDHHGRAVLLSGLAWGAAIVGVGLSRQLWLVLLLLAAGGAATFVGDVFRTTIWNQTIPDELRGRLAGLELLVGSAGPALGDLRGGLVATRLGLRPSIWIGGLSCVAAGSMLTAAIPALWRYRARSHPPAPNPVR